MISAVTASPELSAVDQIRAVANRYCRGVDRLDSKIMKSAYWPDAIDDHGVYVGSAHAFCDRVVSSHARFLATMHCIFNHHIEFDGPDMAHGEIYNVTYLHRRDTEDTQKVFVDTWWGRYLDRYERRAAPEGYAWRIAHRVCVHEWTTSSEVQTSMPIAADRFRQGSHDRGTELAIGT